MNRGGVCDDGGDGGHDVNDAKLTSCVESGKDGIGSWSEIGFVKEGAKFVRSLRGLRS